jgi:hypothetical protein
MLGVQYSFSVLGYLIFTKANQKVKGIRLIYINTYTFNSLYERLEDSEEVIITRLHRQYRGQNKKDNRTNNHLQNITQKTKDRARRTSLKTMGEHRCSGRVCSSCSTCDTHRITLFTNPIYLPLLAKRGVANLHKHQSLDTSIFWCQPSWFLLQKSAYLAEKIQRFQRKSSKFQMYMLSYLLYLYYQRRVTIFFLNKVRYTVKPALKGTSI